MLCASALGEHRSAQSFEDKITEMMHVVEDRSKKIQLLESTINYGKELWIEVYSRPLSENDSVIETFDNLKKTWRTRKVNELQDDDTFLGKLLPLLNQAEGLNPWLHSISFMAVAKSLQESRKSNSKLSDFHSFVNFLRKESLRQFHAHWSVVLNDPHSCSSAVLNTLLGNFEDQSRLDQELNLLEKELGLNCSPDVKSYIDDLVKYLNVLKQIKRAIKIFNIFQLADRSKETMTVLSQLLTTSENNNRTSLAELQELTKKGKEIMASFSGKNLDGVIEELSRSATLVDFIKDIVDEDIRFLIDAVEEHSDQFVSESLVSNFIDVHSFLAPLIKKKNKKVFNPQAFLKQLEESCHRHKDIAEKIKKCNANVNSLRGLYTSIANRGELTKEIIGNCLSKGEYWVSQKDGKSEAKMSYVLQESDKNSQRNKSLSDLHDLRSRALLIVSSQSIHSNEKSKDIDFEDFITQVNLLTEIWTLLTKLCSSGYLKYQNFEQKIKTTHGLKTTRDSLKNDFENWENELKTAREKFYFLNYYCSDQICTFYNFLINGSQVITDEVLSLVHFVDRNITKQQLEPHRKSPKMLEKSGSNVTPNLLLSTVGEASEKIFEESQPDPKSMPNDRQSQSHIKLEDRVIEGEIFVATLEPESPLTANVLLALYESTTKAFPEPYQIVFCSSQTTWEEIHLLLKRCFTHSERRYHDRLFCIVNVELLTNELQFKLVNEIKEKGNCCQNGDYQLALICRGGDHHHVVEQFAQNSHHISGMSDLALAGCLKFGWPDVKMITSSLPGLGKTEHIKDEVLEKSMNVATFSISGPFKPCKLIKRLKELKLQTYHCLHLDIGEVSDPLLLDLFLFQLIVIGMVSAGNQFYHLPTTHIYMEIANTLKDSLRESLVVSKYFTRIHLEWQNYKNLLVSNDITSDVQVVCQYLDLFDRGCIGSKEVDFSESNKSKPLLTERCQELLAKYFSSSADVTFTMLHTFLAILADQLKKFSKSAFFKIDNLRYMVGCKASGVRHNLFHALLTVTKELASRAITTPRSSDTRNLSQEESSIALDEAIESTVRSAKDMVERVDGMIQWEDSNHLLVVFHGINSQSITAIYRNRDLVPYSVKKLLESQEMKGNKELDDFNKFTQKQLQEELEKIACMKVVKKSNLFESYALTPDNILKMVLIILRVRVNVPVIIMGETGCGKTSLVRYLANTCGVELCTFSFHAGISEEQIIAFIKEKESFARDIKEQMWIFLDEINTCDHLGLINDIMCHHSMLGRPISKYLVFLAACNPYRLRPEEHIKTAGLKGKDIADEYSKLVYRVHPLPEAMVDFVWDYGSLAPKDERDYIQRMVRGLPEKYEGTLVNVLVASQQFIRDVEKNPFCVSLRDVHRCIRLISWFQSMTETRQKLKTENECPSHLREYQNMTKRYNEKPIVKSIVLALAHCYLSRLPTAALRKDYRKRMVDLFNHHEKEMTFNENLDSFSAIVRVEEEDYLDRMKLPPGTARNAALRENVFVMLVCILNRIPIFVVGKPGCSKSLSVQLIRSNLRGRDSRDPLFREWPQLYVVSYQGSESSTSEGIKKVFEKARKYKFDDKKVLPVVLLDEVGLAENSKNNPLKVLHSLLEPGDGKLPDVAVVGISNWSLDAAKMNRAIHLSRPEPTKEDLYQTGCSLHYAEDQDNSQNLDQDNGQYLTEKQLQCLAEAYFDYQNQQTHANFHGLRDYYALIKSLKGCSNLKKVNISLQRNFGGLPGEVTNIQKIFLDKLKKLMVSSSKDDQVLKIIPVTELIQANLKDPHARHLMLITSGDSATGILKQSIAELKKQIIAELKKQSNSELKKQSTAKLEKETIMIYGSRFEEDLSEEYNYRILSRIILYMERDCILILKDLESIYGSLYDMLNQNYTEVDKKKYCRVALGPYSNPMCQVHNGFRCIVLINQHKVDYSDPPFLNRFEKQVLRFSDVLTEDQQHVVMELRCWVQGMSTVEGFETHFKQSDLFIGFDEDTLLSLVLLHCRDTDLKTEKVLKKCKDELMWIASPDGVLRTQKCELFQENSEQVQELSDEYFRKPLHKGFTAFIQHVMTNHQKPFFAGDEIGSKAVVMTFSSVHTDIHQCLQLGNCLECQVERLSSYKSEKLLSQRISEFWETAEKKLLVLQCKPDLDGSHLMLARCIVEEKRNTYKKCVPEKDRQGFKHVCIVVHVQRGAAGHSVPWQFNFLSGWKQVFLDVLEAPPVPLNNILGQSSQQLLSSSIWPTRRITRNDLLWCFTCIKYTRTERPVDFVLRIAKNLFKSEAVSKVMDKLILQSIEQNVLEQAQETNSKENWQVEVACDRQSLVNSSTFYSALEQFVSRSVRNELAKIVFFLEKENAWPPHLVDDSNRTTMLKLENLWCKFIMDNGIFKIADIPKPLGANTYLLNRTSFDLCLPFIQVVFRKIDSLKELFLEDYESLVKNDNNLDDKSELKQTVRQQQLERFSKMIVNKVPELHCLPADCCNSYMEDLFRTVTSTAEFSHTLSHQRACIVQAAFISEVKQILPANNMPEFCTLLHIFVWVRREHILNLLRMVDYCLPFIGLNVSARLTNDTLCSLKKDMLLKTTETNLYQGLSTPDYSENRTEGSYDGSREGEESTITASESTQEAVTEPKANETTQDETKLPNVVAELKNVSSVSSEIKDKTISETHDKDSIRFGNILVTTYCEEMFPSQAIVQKNGGVKSWTRNANSMLSLALRISECPTALHYLRFCVDFSRIMLSTTALQERFIELLHNLNNIGTTLQPKYLDHKKSFAKITNEIIKPLEKGVKDHTENLKALQKFTARFYCRCIDTNVDTSGARLILEQVFSLKRPELVMMMSPVVSQLLAVEECQSRGIFKNLINDPSLIKKCPCLQNINEVFKDHFLNGLTNYDSYPAVMICDVIQRLLILQINFKVDDTGRFDSKILELAKSAKQLVQDKKHSFCLRVLSAVAFLRGFFTVVAQVIGEKPSVLKKDSPCALQTEVISLLKDAKPPVQIFFIKQLHEHASLFDLQKWFSGNTTLPAIEQMWHDGKSQNKVVFTSVFKYPEYEKAKVAYLDLISKKYSTIEDFLTKCQKSPDHTFALLGMLINIVYLKRAVRKLSDKEELFVIYFEEKVALFPPLCQDLLLRVIGRREFYCPQLQLSPESSVEEVEMALLILHIACVVATGAADEKLPLYRYFTNPSKFERPCVLAHCKEDMHSVFEYRPSVKESVCVTCTCGSRLAFQSNIDKQVCPHCHVKVNNKAKRSPSSETSTTQSISSTSNSSPKWDLRTKQMNPAIYHALHLIVYACYYGGIALGTSSAEKLRSVENILRGLDLENDSQSLESFCFQNIESDLSCLMKILRCKKDVAIKTMHVVVEKSSDLMRSKNLLGTNNCSTPEMRREWEATFSKKTETVFLDAQETSKEIKNMMKLKQTEDSQINTNTLECRILELDNYPVEPEEQNKELKRLFRMTKQPSFEDFRSAFLYSSGNLQVKHSFLTLFFARFDQLSMIHHLHHLLKWSRIVSSSLTLRISRKDAEKKSINDFIKGHLPEVNRSNEERERLQKLFDDFKEAWDKMRDPVNQKHGGKDKMPPLREIDCLAYSLTEGDFGKHLKRAIEILVSYQNSILDAIISLSSSRQHPVVSFLENENSSGVSSVSIQNVKENEIINFQWSDDLFQDHAQNNPEYGKGHEILYDFEQIEMELVNKIVFGKCYLTETVDKFIFAKELFHSCGPLLTKIRLLVKQSPDLPKEVLEDVIKLKENRIEHAIVLLQHVEVLIYLLKRKLKDISADMTLKELADKWSTLLPSPFPVTELLPNASSIKIEHVAALYEALENVLADGAIEGLDDKFRKEMSGDMKKLVSDMVDKDIKQLKSQHFLNVLRRFVFRYLSSETEKCWLDKNKRCWLDENKPLQSYLQEPSLWAPLPLPNLEEIPQDITLKYIDSMINYLKELGQVS